MTVTIAHVTAITARGFNPLDRGNLYQIFIHYDFEADDAVIAFQSPRSEKFVSDNIQNSIEDYG